MFKRRKHLPAEPSPEWFRVNLQALTRRLKDETSATVALCSLPPIGEDPSSSDLFQGQLNRSIEQFSAIIQDIAATEHVDYIPLYEAILTELRRLPCRAFASFRFARFYRDALRILILGKSLDEVAKMNGWSLHTDGVHLNSRGGTIVADFVQEFLNHQTP